MAAQQDWSTWPQQADKDNDNAALEHLDDIDDESSTYRWAERPAYVYPKPAIVPDDEFGTIDGKPMLILGGECE